jgi:ATP synthase I chain
MGPGELTRRVCRAGVLAVAVVAAATALLFGGREAAGVAAGGGIAFGTFRWLARDAGCLAAIAQSAAPPRLLPLGFRQIAAFAAIALLIGSGWCHPLAVAAGIALLPPVLVVQGLRAAARGEA